MSGAKYRDTNKKIDNITDAIAQGMFQESMKGKLDSLEKRKSNLERKLIEAENQLEINTPAEDKIFNYLKKDSNIKQKVWVSKTHHPDLCT